MGRALDTCKADGNPKAGLTGNLWPVTSADGDRVCETLANFSLDDQALEAMACDEDGDGWVHDVAYGDVNSPDVARRANARCNVRVITDWVLNNEYLQKLWVPVDPGLVSTEGVSNPGSVVNDTNVILSPTPSRSPPIVLVSTGQKVGHRVKIMSASHGLPRRLVRVTVWLS